MPYITRDQRVDLDLGIRTEEDAGELTYSITMMLLNLTPSELPSFFRELVTNYLEKKGTRYQYFCDISGAVTNANLELLDRVSEDDYNTKYYDLVDMLHQEILYFYKNVVRPYEDHKILENGDVYPC